MNGSPLYTYELKNWKGLDTLQNLADKDPHYLDDCQDIDFDEAGMITKRRGCIVNSSYSGTINMIYDFQSQAGFLNSSDNQRVLVAHGTQLSLISGFMGAGQTVSTTFAISNSVHYACSSNNGVCYISNEQNAVPKMLAYINGAWVFQSAELNAPAAAPSVAVGSTGSFTGSHQAIYTYNDKYGNESNPSDESVSVDLTNQNLSVGLTASADPSVESTSVYILGPLITTFKYVGTFANTTGTVSVSISPTTLAAGDDAEYTRYPCPKGRYIRIFNDMLIVGGGDDVVDQIFCSNWRYHRQFSLDTDFDRVTSNDAQPVKGFGALFSDLVVAKADSLHLGSGAENTEFHCKPYNQEYGILGQPSITGFHKRLAYFSDDGIYVDSGDIPTELSARIRPTIRLLNPDNLITRTDPKQIAIHYRFYKKLYFAVRRATGTGNNDSILVYNYENDSWTIYSGIEVTALAQVQIDRDWEFLFGGNASGKMFVFDPPDSGRNHDDLSGSNTAISAYAETVWIHLPKAKGLENWERTRTESAWLMIYAGGQPATGNSTITLTTVLYTDFSDTARATYSQTFAAAAYPAKTPIQPKLISSLGGKTLGGFDWIKLKFINDTLDEHFKINKLVFGFRVRPTIEE